MAISPLGQAAPPHPAAWALRRRPKNPLYDGVPLALSGLALGAMCVGPARAAAFFEARIAPLLAWIAPTILALEPYAGLAQ
jgi:hypothetical protein